MKMFMRKGNFISDDILECASCHERIEEAALYVEKWNRKRGKETATYCINCQDQVKSMADMSLFRLVGLVAKIPADAVPVLSSFPGLVQRGDATVWSAAREPDGAKVQDNTRLAGRQSWEGASIGAEVKDPELLKDQAAVHNFLETLQAAELCSPVQTAAPALECDKCKLLKGGVK